MLHYGAVLVSVYNSVPGQDPGLIANFVASFQFQVHFAGVHTFYQTYFPVVVK